MSKNKYEDMAGEEYEAIVTFADVSGKGNPMGRFRNMPVFVSQIMEQPKQGGTYLCKLNHSCFGKFY